MNLLESGASIAQSATAAGFGSPAALRRAFLARYRVTPSGYQQRFRSTLAQHAQELSA
ncbi:MAG: transcriptional regulator containing an amidase domain and an AraC-type DNA-binding domain [Microbacterium sp.]|nr:transcriptional regulator containing an amidase domain and an AraC-type DNA-binding domain [Microbacterium sp.]